MDGSDPNREPAAPESPLPARGPRRILLVEDHEDTLTYLSRYLTSNGHAVHVARTTSEALSLVQNWAPDTLLCDISLPDGDGCDLLGRLAEHRPSLCIAMSGFGMNTDLRRSRSAGFQHHLTKPFLPDDLDELLAQA